MKILNLLVCFMLLSSCANAQKETTIDFKSDLLSEAHDAIKDYKQTERTQERLIKFDESIYTTLKFINDKPKWNEKTKTRFNQPLLDMVDEVNLLCLSAKHNLSDYERILLIQTINEKIEKNLNRLKKFRKHSKS